MQPVIDEQADEAQRDALFSIMTGKETDEAATFFWVYSAMCDKIHDPVDKEIRIASESCCRTASNIPGTNAGGAGRPHPEAWR
jgi:hypothetical protein